MDRKGYRTTRKFLSTFVLCQIICCVLTFNPRVESSSRIIGADSAFMVDGLIVSGFDTRLSTAFSEAPEPMNLAGASGGAPVMSQLTPELVARMFPAAPRSNIEKHLPLVRRALAERGLVDKAMVLMALATVRAECATFAPISEVPAPINTEPSGPPFNKYDHRQDLGNTGPPDGATYKGRGFIQLTGRRNYRFYGSLLGYNLLSNPELANTPQPAAQILAAYLKENESSIRSALATGDLAAARRTVNGGLNGLVSFRTAFLTGDLLIRGHDGDDIALSKELRERRENRKVKEVKAASTSASRSARSKEKMKDDVAVKKTRAKKKDDVADNKTRRKKKDDVADEETSEKNEDDETDEDDEKKGKKKGKGFFLFRPFRMFRGS